MEEGGGASSSPVQQQQQQQRHKNSNHHAASSNNINGAGGDASVLREKFSHAIRGRKSLEELKELVFALETNTLADQVLKPLDDSRNGETILHLACVKGSPVEFIDLLIQKCPDSLRIVTQKQGWTALHIACNRPFSSHTQQLVKLLLNRYPEATIIRDQMGYTPLHLAIAVGMPGDVLHPDFDFYEELMDLPASDDGNTPLHLACVRLTELHVPFILHAIHQNSDTDTSGMMKQSCDALLSVNSNCKTPLHILCDQNNQAAAQENTHPITHRRRASTNMVSSSDVSASNNGVPLPLLKPQKIAEIIQLYVDAAREALLMVDADRNTPIHLLSQYPTTPNDLLLHMAGCCPESLMVKNAKGNTPLHCALWNDHGDLVRFAAQHIPGALSISYNKGRGLLNILAGDDYVNPISDVLDLFAIIVEACPSTLQMQEIDGNTALHRLCSGDHDPSFMGAVILLCMEHCKGSLQIQNSNGNTPLHNLCSGEHVDPSSKDLRNIIERAVDHYPAALIIPNNRGDTPVHCACKVGGILLHAVVSLAVSNCPAALSLSNKYGQTPMHVLLKERDTIDDMVRKSLELIVSDRPSVLKQKDHDGNTPLHLLCDKKHVPQELIQLVARGNPDGLAALNASGETPLHHACRVGAVVDVAASLAAEMCPESISKLDRHGNTPLRLLLCSGNSNYAEELLDPVEKMVRNCPEILHVVGKQLRKHSSSFDGASGGATLDGRPLKEQHDTLYDSPLHLLCRVSPSDSDIVKTGKIRMLSKLVSLAVELRPEALNVTNNRNENLLHVIFNGSELPLELHETLSLIANKCESVLLMQDDKGNTPFHLLCKNGPKNALEIADLISKRCPGSLFVVANSNGDTPLHFVCDEGGPLDHLIQVAVDKCPASLYKANKIGKSALHLICERRKGPIDVRHVEMIFDQSPYTLKMVDLKGNTPLHSACTGYREVPTDVFDFIVSRHPESLALVNKEGNTPIHLSCEYRDVKFISVVVQSAHEILRSSLNIKSISGESALDIIVRRGFHRTEEGDKLYRLLKPQTLSPIKEQRSPHPEPLSPQRTKSAELSQKGHRPVSVRDKSNQAPSCIVCKLECSSWAKKGTTGIKTHVARCEQCDIVAHTVQLKGLVKQRIVHTLPCFQNLTCFEIVHTDEGRELFGIDESGDKQVKAGINKSSSFFKQVYDAYGGLDASLDSSKSPSSHSSVSRDEKADSKSEHKHSRDEKADNKSDHKPTKPERNRSKTELIPSKVTKTPHKTRPTNRRPSATSLRTDTIKEGEARTVPVVTLPGDSKHFPADNSERSGKRRASKIRQLDASLQLEDLLRPHDSMGSFDDDNGWD